MKNKSVPVGTKIIHKTTLEKGVVVGNCISQTKCMVIYDGFKLPYPQPKRNIFIAL